MERRCWIDWDQVREKVRQDEWAQALVKNMSDSFERHLLQYPGDPPTGESGWGHYYFCQDCGTGLQYDITKPHEHRCTRCGTVYSGYPYDNTWINSTHAVICAMLQNAAVLAHLPGADARCQQYIRQTIWFYTEHYDTYENTSTHCGKGKIQPDNLTEAWLVSSLAQTMNMAADLPVFSDEDRKEIGRRFFRPEAMLLKPQITKIHNIHATMAAAVAAAAEIMGDERLLSEAIEGEWGFWDQMKGVREDGFWFEVSDSYHSLTLNALLAAAVTAGRCGWDLYQNPVLAKMGRVYGRLAYPDGLLPAYHDGWYGHHLYDYAYQFEQLSRIYDTPEDPYYSRLLRLCYEMKEANGVKTPTGYARDSLQALLYGPRCLERGDALPETSDFFPDTGIAILRNRGLRVNLKSTKYGGGHDHNDKCSIEVYSQGEYWSTDPGTSGYSLPLTGRWSRTSLAHNMVCVDGMRQKDSDGEICFFSPTKATARADSAYDQAKIERTIELTKNGYCDMVNVICAAPSTIDYVLHCIGDVSCDLPFEAVTLEPLADAAVRAKHIPESSYDTRFIENGYDQLMEMRGAVADADFQVLFTAERQCYSLSCKGEAGTQVFLGKCYATSYVDIQNILIIRRRNKETAKFDLTVSIQNKT